MRRLMDLPVDIISRFVDQSPHRRGAAPIGSLRTPKRLLGYRRKFLNSEEGTAEFAARDLARMAASAAPVDVGDADTIGLAMITARRLGLRITRAHVQSMANGLEPIARVPMELAIEMIQFREPHQYA